MENVKHLTGVQSNSFPVMDATVSTYRGQASSGQTPTSPNKIHKKKCVSQKADSLGAIILNIQINKGLSEDSPVFNIEWITGYLQFIAI